MGITKVIYRVFEADENEGGLYFNNSQFNTLQPALEKLIAEFDFKKLNLCAWMMTRKFNWLNNTSLFDYQYENDYLQMIPKLDVFNPDAVRKLIAVYKELASRHIDCILIQDDFTLRYNEGFSSWGKAQFTSAVRAPAVEKLMMADGTPYNQAWKRVKADQLNKVLKVLVENCKMVNSAIKVGINIYYETPAFPDKAETWYGHSLKAILDTGVDYIYLMSYQRQIKDEMNWDEERNRAFFKEMVEKAFDMCKEKLVVKLQIRDWKTAERIPAAEVRTYLDLIPSRVDRVCFTPVKIEDYDYLEELIGGAAKK
ncbi:MAG: poly-beta,6-N-acetyl-D-glucosamine N-deacetylase [Acidobacteriota bacterium]|nr:poly-beta,6-N-acetyl-D-glucosamine N-deacetylase [Acidobacteriota bacterium]